MRRGANTNFSVYGGTVFAPPTKYDQLNTNDMSIQNDGTLHKITFNTSPYLDTNYSLTFPDDPPGVNQILLYNGTQFVWEDASQISGAIQNIVVVQKAPAMGQFSTVQAALASITTASAINPFLVYIGPGVYIEDNPIQLLPFVNVMGCSRQQVIITPQHTTVPLVIGAHSATIQAFTLSGAPTEGIFYDGSAAFGVLAVFNMLFDISTTMVNFTSSTGVNRSFFNDCQSGGVSNPVNGFVFTSTGNQLSILIESFTWNPVVNTNLVDFMQASGPQTTIVVSSNVIGSSLLTPVGTAVDFYNGAQVNVQNSLFASFAVGLDNPSTGTGANITVADTLFKTNTQDITISNPATTGTISAAADRTKITIVPSSAIALVINDVSGAIVLTGGIYEGLSYAQNTNISTQIQQGSNLGVITGGTFTSVGLDITVQVGTGYLMIGTPPSDFLWFTQWNTQTITVPNNILTYLYIDNTGTLQQTSAEPNPRTMIQIGLVYATAGSVIINEAVPRVAVHTASQIDDSLSDVFGPLFGSGCLVTQNVTPLHLDVSSGTYTLSLLMYNPATGLNITWIAFFGNGSGGWNNITQNAITTQWDDGSGVLASIPVGIWAKGTLFIVGDGIDQEYLFVFGQQLFATQDDATDGPIPLPPVFFSGGNIVQLAAIVVTEGDVTLPSGRIVDIRPRLAFVGSTVTSNGTVSQVDTGAGLTGGPITTIGTISIENGGVTNAMLVNDDVTINTGAGLSGGGTVLLGDSLSLSVPNGGITNAMLVNDATTITAGTGLTGGGLAVLGAGVTLSVPNGGITNAMLQNDDINIVTGPGSGLAGGADTVLGGTVSLFVPAAGITNAMLVNDDITISSGAGLTGGGTVVLGDTTTLSIAIGGVTNAMLVNDDINIVTAVGSGLSGGADTVLGGTVSLFVPTGGITNNMLQNSATTVNAGAGLTGGGLAPLGGSTTLSIATGGVTNAMLVNDSVTIGTAPGSGLTGGGIVDLGDSLALSVPAGGITNTMLQNDDITITAGSGLTGGGSAVLGAGVTISVPNGGITNAMLQNDDITINTAAGSGLSGGADITLGGSTSLFISSAGVTNAMLQNSTTTITAGSGLSGGGTVPLGGSTTLLIPAAGVTNTMLQNSNVTITAGSGLSGGGAVSLGGSTTLSIPNSGVTNAMLLNSSLTVTAGNGLTGGGVVSLGGSVTLSAVAPSATFITSGTTFTSSATITASTLFKFTLVGGGGGGGGSNTNNRGSSGGGGAAVGILFITGITPSTAYTIAIGTAGVGGNAVTPVNPTVGGNTTITIPPTVYTARGGGAGVNETGASSDGGAGGTVTNCTINLTGGNGGSCQETANTASGRGGDAIGWGAGAADISTDAVGLVATGYGGGGGGGKGTAGTGGNGRPGMILVEWYN